MNLVESIKSDIKTLEGYHDSPEGSRDTSERNPLVTAYDNQYQVRNGRGISGHMNLQTWMSIHGISAKYQDTLAKMVLDAGEGNAVQVPDEIAADYNENREENNLDPITLWIELSEWHKKELGESDELEGASVEDIIGAVTNRILRRPDLQDIVAGDNILKLNDAIESVATFHEGGDLGSSDVSIYVNEVFKEIGYTPKMESTMKEDDNDMPASPSEENMAGDQAEYIKYAIDEIKDSIEAGNSFPEWFQNKLSGIYETMKDLHGYMEGDKRNDDEEMETMETTDLEEKAKNPYAVGMAQAMKMTGDKPPLKKSTISKAHDIAKAVEKEGINESVSVTTTVDDNGQPSLNVNATGEQALAIAQLLTLAGVEKPQQEEAVEEDFANSPDEKYQDTDYIINNTSGGLNGPKGSHPAVSGGDNPMQQDLEYPIEESVKFEDVYNEWENFKNKE